MSRLPNTPPQHRNGYQIEALHHAAPHTRQWTSKQWAIAANISEKTWERARQTGQLSLGTADQIATRLGIHPINIWPHFHAGINTEEAA